MWRESAADLNEARRNAQRLADDEGVEFFVYSFRSFTEVARLFPSRSK